MRNTSTSSNETFILVILGLLAAIIIAALFWVFPQYNVYQASLGGQAALAHARSEREIQVQDSIAQKEAAQNLADANAIIGPALTPEYLKYLELRTLREGFEKGNVIYFYGGNSPVVVPVTPKVAPQL